MTSDAASDPGDGAPDFSSFLDDFYVECDEHLSMARSNLLALEGFLQAEQVDRAVLDELFRSYHSLKGLAAMVEVREAEQVAHRLESYLGLLRRSQARLSAAGHDALVAGTIAIEQVVAAKRNGGSPPDVASLLVRLDAFAPPTVAAEATPPPSISAPTVSPKLDSATRIEEQLRAGGRAWTIRFTPSPAAAERGVDVNSVRQQLQSRGELVHSEPRIEAGGRIEFHFVLVTAADDELVLDVNDGVQIRPYDATPAAVAESPPAQPAAKPMGNSTHLVPANLVRVDLARLDDLMHMVSELVLSRSRLEDVLQRLNGVVPPSERRALEEINQAIENQLRDLRDGVMRVRMIPIREVFTRMQFVVRDLIREQGKRAALQLHGEETQIDKYIVERMMDPLLHLVRNAVGHGLETPEERRAAGKPPEARVDLRAAATGDTIVIEVEDDGRGIDAEAVLARAAARGIAVPAKADAAVLLDVLCLPGFSTRDQADRSSGRGVGMDVVRKAVEELGGTLSLQTELGRGTRFTILLPLTLAITDALIVGVGSRRYAVPQVAVREVLRIDPESIRVAERSELISYHNGVLPLLRLDRFFGGEVSRAAQHVLVVGEGAKAVGLVVHTLRGLREVVVRPLMDRLVQVSGISGATELGDGQVVLILDVADLIRSAAVTRNDSLAVLPKVPSRKVSEVGR